MKRTRPLVMLVLAVGLTSLFGLACTGDTVVNSSGVPSGISVEGSGRASGTPDIVFLQLGVNLERGTVAEAREAAASAMQAVIDTLRRNGVAERDIQTSRFTVNPQYDFSSRSQVVRAYRVTNVVTAKITQLESASKAIDDAATAGGDAVIVQSVSFQIEDPSELQQQARVEAMQQARERADELAALGGVEIGKTISISEHFQTVVPQSQGGIVAPRTGDSSTPIQSGELEVIVSVNVLYAIE
jgi:uncharacterized protein YggE